ncbi:MAG: NADH-quinone oxidoreductase subunit NuoK [Chloroflexota bacterium]
MPTESYLILGAALFAIGATGVVLRSNALAMLVGVELMLNAANITFVAAAQRHAQVSGEIAALFVIVVAAAKLAVGLAIAVDLARRGLTADTDEHPGPA